MYIPRNWEFGPAFSKLRNFGGGFEPPKHPPPLGTPVFRIIDRPTCPCNKADQTVDHLIYQCPLLHINRLLRKNVQQSGNWPASKQELITKHLSSFINFTKSINFDEL
jgi:hypothetical protein